MRPYELTLSSLVRSPLMAALLLLLTLVAVPISLTVWPSEAIGSIQLGLVNGAPTLCGPISGLSMIGSFIMLGGVMFVLLLLNRWFGLTLSSSKLFLGIVALTMAAQPPLMLHISQGMVLALTMLVCLVIMYTTYQPEMSKRVMNTRRIFLVFAVLTAGACSVWAFAWYLPMMLMGCAQMRCLNLRAMMAAGIGVVTPLWILWGFGIVTPEMLMVPDVALPSPGVFQTMSVPLIVTSIFTILMALLLTISNVIRIYGHNAQKRAYNGILALITFWTLLSTAIDFGHSLVYLPLLFALTALQLTLYYRLNAERRAYLVVLLTITFYIVLYAWNLIAVPA